jgi:hypothetical protein
MPTAQPAQPAPMPSTEPFKPKPMPYRQTVPAAPKPKTDSNENQTVSLHVSSPSNFPMDGQVQVFALGSGERKRLGEIYFRGGSQNTELNFKVPEKTEKLSFVNSSGFQTDLQVSDLQNQDIRHCPLFGSVIQHSAYYRIN